MRSRLLLALVLASGFVRPASAAVAYDAFSTSGIEVDPNWTHTPAGVPAGVVCWVYLGTGQSVTSVDYGTAALSAMTASPADHSTGETGSVHAWFAGSGLPTGAQTVDVDVGGLTALASCVTVTASADTQETDSCEINEDSVSNAACTLSLGGVSSFAAIGFLSGENSPASTSPLTGWTDRWEQDNGLQSVGVYTYNTVGTSDVTAGWTQSNDDAAAVGVAISEVGGPGPSTAARKTLLGVGR